MRCTRLIAFATQPTVTVAQFRNLALSLPKTIEASHMGHADFRVLNKIFATLPDNTRGMVKLTPKQQDAFISTAPKVFQPVPGGWGDRGATHVHLKAATEGPVREALVAAWRNT